MYTVSLLLSKNILELWVEILLLHCQKHCIHHWCLLFQQLHLVQVFMYGRRILVQGYNLVDNCSHRFAKAFCQDILSLAIYSAIMSIIWYSKHGGIQQW